MKFLKKLEKKLKNDKKLKRFRNHIKKYAPLISVVAPFVPPLQGAADLVNVFLK